MADDDSLAETDSSPDPNPCPICLSAVTQDSYLDQCFHKYCYNCIIRWADVVANKQSCASSTLKCPFCKTENFSVVYGYDGTSFQRHYFGRSLKNSEFFSGAHRYRLKCYYTEPGNLAEKLGVPRNKKFRKYVQKNHFLPNWLRRDIQALLQEEDVDIIMHHILGVIDSLRRVWSNNLRLSAEMVQKEFRDSVTKAVRPFLSGGTERFVNELELFLASGLNIEAFDKVYIDHLSWKVPEIRDDNEHGEPLPVVPCLYIFDEDSDAN